MGRSYFNTIPRSITLRFFNHKKPITPDEEPIPQTDTYSLTFRFLDI